MSGNFMAYPTLSALTEASFQSRLLVRPVSTTPHPFTKIYGPAPAKVCTNQASHCRDGKASQVIRLLSAVGLGCLSRHQRLRSWLKPPSGWLTRDTTAKWTLQGPASPLGKARYLSTRLWPPWNRSTTYSGPRYTSPKTDSNRTPTPTNFPHDASPSAIKSGCPLRTTRWPDPQQARPEETELLPNQRSHLPEHILSETATLVEMYLVVHVTRLEPARLDRVPGQFLPHPAHWNWRRNIMGSGRNPQLAHLPSPALVARRVARLQAPTWRPVHKLRFWSFFIMLCRGSRSFRLSVALISFS